MWEVEVGRAGSRSRRGAPRIQYQALTSRRMQIIGGCCPLRTSTGGRGLGRGMRGSLACSVSGAPWRPCQTSKSSIRGVDTPAGAGKPQKENVKTPQAGGPSQWEPGACATMLPPSCAGLVCSAGSWLVAVGEETTAWMIGQCGVSAGQQDSKPDLVLPRPRPWAPSPRVLGERSAGWTPGGSQKAASHPCM